MNMDFYLTDVDSLLAHMKHADKQIKLKRRWLLGLPTSKYEEQQTESLMFIHKRYMLESFLREDDLFYETSKTVAEKAFDMPNMKNDCHDFQEIMQNLGIPCLTNELGLCLDDISNKGLYLLAMHLTRGHFMLSKTRWKLKKVIQKSLQRMKKCEGNDHSKECAGLSQVVSDPYFFRKGSTVTFGSSYKYASNKVSWVLGNLKNFPLQVLISMYRKLKGESGKMLHLGTRRSGWNRDRLIALVKKICESRLSELENGDELPQSIAKAMAVTTLSMNLTPGIRKQNFADFYQFRPDIVTLQNNIAKAIWLINEKVRVSELKELQMLLGLNTDLPIKGLRSAIRNLLTKYLFECDDMDAIPESLLDTLSVINRRSRTVPLRYFPKEEIDEDVECILGVSAQAKQVILDLLPDHDYYQDFTDAYMEDLEESESDESDTDMALLFESYESPNNLSYMIDSNETVESIGDSLFTEKNVSDTYHAISVSNISTDTDDVSKHTGAAPGFSGANLKPKNTGAVDLNGAFDDNNQSGSRSKYLCGQEACDETSLVAYKLIGHILKECARIEGLDLDPADISYLTAGHAKTDHPPGAPEKPSSMDGDVGGMFICQVVQDLLPSISNSVRSKLEDMMSLL